MTADDRAASPREMDPGARRLLFLAIVVAIPAICAAAVLLFASREEAPSPAPRRGVLLFEATRAGAFAADQSAPGAVTEVPDPLGGGRTVLAFSVHDDDVAPVTPTTNPRAQLLSPSLITPGRTFWLSTEFLVPRSFPDVSSWLTLLSVYGPPATGPGPWDLAIDAVAGGGDELMIRRGDDYRDDIPWAMPTPRGRWTRVTVHEKFAQDGFIELWVDGHRVTFFADSPYNPLGIAPTTRLEMATRGSTNGGGPNTAKIMQYRRRGQFALGTVYFTGLRIGTSREVVESSRPAASRRTAGN